MPPNRMYAILGLLLLISYSLLSNVKIVRDASRSLSAYTNNDKLSHLPPALRKLDIQKKNLDQSHLPPPRVDKQQQQQRQGSENNNLRAPKNDGEDSYPGKRNYILCIYWSFFTSSCASTLCRTSHHIMQNNAHLLYCSKSPFFTYYR